MSVAADSTTMMHVEIARRIKSTLKRREIEGRVKNEIDHHWSEDFARDFKFEDFIGKHPDLKEHIQCIRIYTEEQPRVGENQRPARDHDQQGHSVITDTTDVITNGYEDNKRAKYYVFELNEDGEEAEYMDDDDDNDQSASSHHWILPSASFDGLWDSLIFENSIQSRLMKYINTALLFAEKGVDTNLISWNKVILLHGPPGTGKTSLCKALAQKAVIRLSHRYVYGQLIEINSHSLFSKWFSESGKLVMKMFEKIHDLVEDPKSLVFLLIDEVESLAQCRQSAEAGNEPTDSIRAVNALLTQIDRIKKYPNVVILTTSNIVGSIDLAFVDRADLKIFIGPPPAEIVYGILATSINELIRVGIICAVQNDKETFLFPSTFVKEIEKVSCSVGKLFKISSIATGMSGRTLRKIPFLAYANFMDSATCNLELYLEAMERAVNSEIKEASALTRTLKKT